MPDKSKAMKCNVCLAKEPDTADAAPAEPLAAVGRARGPATTSKRLCCAVCGGAGDLDLMASYDGGSSKCHVYCMRPPRAAPEVGARDLSGWCVPHPCERICPRCAAPVAGTSHAGQPCDDSVDGRAKKRMRRGEPNQDDAKNKWEVLLQRPGRTKAFALERSQTARKCLCPERTRTHTHTHAHTHPHTHPHTHAHTHPHTHACKDARSFARMHATHAGAQARAYAHRHPHTQSQTRAYARTHARRHARTHARMQGSTRKHAQHACALTRTYARSHAHARMRKHTQTRVHARSPTDTKCRRLMACCACWLGRLPPDPHSFRNLHCRSRAVAEHSKATAAAPAS
jgi:hypothetical protein